MCPPGVDQTFRSAQCWQLIAPRIEQSCSLTANNNLWDSTIQSCIFNPKGLFGAWMKLARPVRPSGTTMAAVLPSTYVPAVRPNHPSLGFDKLPVELILEILEESGLSKSDVLALAFAFPSTRPIIVSYIHTSYAKMAAPWAGTPMACIGNYTTDLPSSFMTDTELAAKFETWAAWTPPQYQPTGRGFGGSRRGLPPARRFFWDCTNYSKPSNSQIEEQEWQMALMRLREQSMDPIDPTTSVHEDMEYFRQQISCPEMFPRGNEWVLRNLTTKEYYVPQAFPETARNSSKIYYDAHQSDTITFTKPVVLGFDDVLLLRTCWTSTFNDAHNLQESVRKGSWAGHCFDIVTKEVFDREGSDEWRDASTELLEEARSNWDSLTGRNIVSDESEDTDEE
ncbi:hypothetical protein K504DRAFT_463387 [Pleomassaria siparia CBS 279.74]|uniref:Uncharacterized protein n=1 Tax=Pleomassaria siparia CBS 279.74 TaxID=1314801 RepID=A0A6G1JU12_9PLEO|nr:hypothetical protein K504DRAFT_463387 [Pleomassaria siparia CBS 279.74]